MLMKLRPDAAGIKAGLDAIDQALTKYGLNRKEISRAMLVSEELMNSLSSHATADARMQLTIRKWLGEVVVEVTMDGEAYDFINSLQTEVPLDTEDISLDAEAAIRNIILRSYVSDLKYRNRGKVNSVRLTVVHAPNRRLYYTLGAMLLAILVGIVLRNLTPEGFQTALDANLLTPVKTMFMNSLKAMVGPVVFFSIVSCVSQFSNLSELGKLGGRIISMYLATTLLATAVGIGAFLLFQPGSPGSLTAAAGAAAAQQTEMSIVDTIVNIVPDNFVRPFLETNMLQLIFLALFCGVCVGMIGRFSKTLSEIFEACNELFLKIITVLVKVIPLAAFCSMLSMVLTTGVETLLSVLNMILVFLFGLLVMLCLYCLMMVISGVNPLPFLRKYGPVMLQTFSISSSNASLPVNMEACENRLGVSSKVYSLSLPLGATMNMDGTCIRLAVVALALARIYGIDISGADLLPFALSLIFLSIGAPGIPGAGLVCLSLLVTQMGIPIEAIGLVIGIDPLFTMFCVMSNCAGDVAITTIAAKKSGLLDEKHYGA